MDGSKGVHVFPKIVCTILYLAMYSFLGKGYIEQGWENIFCEGPDSKYFGLCGPKYFGLCKYFALSVANYSILSI